MDFSEKRRDSKKSDSCGWQVHAESENSKWLAETTNEMEQSVKRMLKLIEENDESWTKNDQIRCQDKPKLIAGIEEFYNIYQSLAERYDDLIGALPKNVQSEFQVHSGHFESGSDHGSPLTTPDEKLGLHKSGQLSVSFSSGGATSDLSLREGNESSSSSSSSDSDSESFNSSINNYVSSGANTHSKELNWKIVESGTELSCKEGRLQLADENNGDSSLKVEEHENYEELIARIIKYEEESRISNLKLQLSEQEVSRLKSELEKNESFIALASNVNVQLEAAKKEIEMRDDVLEVEKARGFELQKLVAETEAHVSQLNSEIEMLNKELEANRDKLKGSDAEILKLKEIIKCNQDAQGQLKLSEENIAILEDKLASERRLIMDLEEMIVRLRADLCSRDNEVKELKIALCDAQDSLTFEKARLQSDVIRLSEKEMLLETRLKEWELHGKALEDKLRQCNAEKMEMKAFHDMKEVERQGEISRLKVDLATRGEHVEALNKNLDSHKFNYDMLVAEKDGITAKLDSLRAEMRSQDIQIGEMNREKEQLVFECERARKVIDELRVKAEELEKEAERQKIVILDGAEEKREAIRQLCISLDHYRSGYRELCQAFQGHKQHAMMAS